MDFKALFTLWFNAVKDPKNTFAQERSKADFKAGSINVILGGLIAGIIAGVYSGSIVSSAVGAAIGGWIGWLIGGAFIFLFAKLLGGNGEYMTQIYLVSLYAPMLVILQAIFAPVGAIGIIISIFGLYLLTLALKEAHQYSMNRAIATWLIPVGILLVIVVLMVIMFAALFGGMFMSALPQFANIAEFLPAA